MSYASVYIQVPGAMVALISGLIVRCWTLSSVRITPSPPRWIIPKIGGFSVASVPRPRFPLSRLRRPCRPFFRPHRAFPCAQLQWRPHLTFHLVGSRRRGLLAHNALAQLTGHLMRVVLIEIEFLGHLVV